MIDAQIIDIDIRHLRFQRRKPKRINLSSISPVYNCVYVTLITDAKKYKGYALTCELRDYEVKFVIEACQDMFNRVVTNLNVAAIYRNFAPFWKILTKDTKVTIGYYSATWNDPLLHIAAAAIANALWDMWARIEDKPVWKLLTDMTPEQLVSIIDFDSIQDMMYVAYGNFNVPKTEAIYMLKEREARKKELETKIQETGYPAYAADGWTGCRYSQIYDFAKRYVKSGFETFKVDIDNVKVHVKKDVSRIKDIQSCFFTRRVIGWKKRKLIIHMNHALSPNQMVVLNVNPNKYSIEQESRNPILKLLKPYCIENVMSHENAQECCVLKTNLKYYTKLCIGEMCSNYAVLKMEALNIHMASDFWLMNVARMSGINEVLAMYFYTERYKTRNWGYANGVGLGEMIQHLQIWDYICLSQTVEEQLIQFADQQHGYFERPVFIRNGRYMPPKFPGYSTKLKDKCIKRWSYPNGTRWRHLNRVSMHPENVEQNIS